ncbi:MAG: Tetratricopeptide TPR_2 repeat protein [Candidatus Amesbacteria bacterium GW2011_GWC2_45_19]|uniref:Tetratricopeptide TPR_2 repeat protein n=1 Tax=Candidatus Amesbacteria bacterium GW2011_GWC2_45_19 TaxID=1618366 RepID=A0A0G1M0Z0_9BACT|nr:MAG: Tetratricopeptide TPR_2 repeat protein [Candidatus Amesbacteria bacterium GW2011_GWC2_45_19]
MCVCALDSSPSILFNKYMKLAAIFCKIGFIATAIGAFLLPFFFLPITSEFYDFNKQALVIFLALASLLLLTGSFVAERQVTLTFSPFGLPILAILVSLVLSTVFRSPNRLDALIDPGQVGTYLGLAVIFFCAINFIRTKSQLDIFSTSLAVSAALLGLITILWTSGLAAKIPLISNIQFLNSVTWSPTGSPLATLSLFIAFLPFLALQLIREKTFNFKSLLLAVCFALILTASGLLIYRSDRPIFLSHRFSWAIALESLKVSPFLGTGPGSYLADFTQFRPVTYNLTPNWSVRFTSASNYYLHLLATLGLLGTVAYLWLIYRAAAALKKSGSLQLVPVLVIFATQLFLPAYFIQTVFLFLFLILAVASLKLAGSSLIQESSVDIVAASSKSSFLPIISLILAIATALPAGYFFARSYLAEVLFQAALTAAAKNDGKATYETLIKAISANPYRDSYRVVYSQTNLLLANSLASNPAAAGLTDADKNTITQLVQQAIREAKNAVAVNPAQVANLENLAGVYRNLLNFAQGADAWTVASYRQAIALDPVNPNLRIALGGVLYAQKNYDDAIRLFQQAVDLKPDLANAHYNLAAAYREKGERPQAVASLETVLTLVDKSSADYTKVAQELADLNAAPATPAASQLTQPEPLPTPKVNPPLRLDESLSP